VKRLHEFHDALKQIFGTNLAAGKSAVASNVRGNDPRFGADKAIDGDGTTYWATNDGVTTATLTVDLGTDRPFNVVGTEEMISLGQRVAEYEIDALVGGTWTPVAKGTTIGYRKLDRFPKVTASKVRLTITRSLACPVICGFGIYLDTISPPESFEPANALQDAKNKH